MNTAGSKTGDEPSRVNEESSSLSVDNNSRATATATATTQINEPSSSSRQSSINLVGLATGATATAAAAAATEKTTPTTLTPTSATNPDMKRSAVKELIERYFFQLQRGCGNPECSNIHCASSGQVPSMTPNEIAARAIQLFSQDAQLCDFESQPPKVARTKNESPTSSHSVSVVTTPSNPESDSSSSNESNSGNSTITTGSRSSTSSSGSSSSSYSRSVIATPEGNSSYNSAVAAASAAHSTAADATKVNNASTLNASLECEDVEFEDVANDASAINATTATATAPSPSSSRQFLDKLMDSNALTKASTRLSSTPSPPPKPLPVLFVNEQILDDLIDECQQLDAYDRLVGVIEKFFSSTMKLSRSFKRCNPEITQIATGMAASKLHELLGKSPNTLKKEDLRMLEGEADKDEDSSVMEQVDEQMDETMAEAGASASSGEQSSHALSGADTLVDLESLRRIKKKLFRLDSPAVGEAITSAVVRLAECLKFRLEPDWEKVLHCFVIGFDLAASSFYSMAEQEYLERALPKLCHATRVLPVAMQARLARIWAQHCKEQLLPLVRSCQQLITMQVIMDEESVQENADVIAVTKVLKIAFYANILAGQWEQPKVFTTSTADCAAGGGDSNSIADDDDVFSYTQVSKPHYPKFAEDKLEAELGVSCMDCRVPLFPFEEFYNEPLSDAIQMDRDYLSYKNLSLNPHGEDTHFSFMLYSFVLTPATKVIALYYDSRIRMYSERNSSLFSLLNYFGDNNDVGSRPDLKLKVRRDNIIDDALIGLEMVAMGNPKDLKKQLVVEFVGEEGIDEGGVSKEFFQLIVEELFNPDFGMFSYQEDTNTVWFNSSPFENEAQFTLIGIILGLAIYNNIILAVHFPMVVYRKLMGGQGTFFDLADWNPTLYRSLKSMLDYQEPDMEEVFMQTFKISYNDMFGELVEYELKPGGADIVVGQHNKQEFVDLYSDFLLNKSAERQFKAFKKGFEMVTDESPLKLLFRPEEIELLVCGSRKFDFVELEESTEYEGGYTKDTPIIKDFWSVVHMMPEESKRKLLEFTTGSDRVPVGGLSRLKLLITRHGPDSERLPTSHTCFNVLLLPEYSSKEKLEERLLKAINYSKGFGML